MVQLVYSRCFIVCFDMWVVSGLVEILENVTVGKLHTSQKAISLPRVRYMNNKIAPLKEMRYRKTAKNSSVNQTVNRNMVKSGHG